MDNATKRKLRQPDQFHTVTEHGLDWAKENRQTAITAVASAVAAILLIVGGFAFYNHRTSEAATALGGAMQTYMTPVAQPGQPVPPGTKTFPDEKTRAIEANHQFVAVADQFGATEPGKLARYFAGVTFMEFGQNSQAEDTLKKVAGGWNGDVAASAKLALAELYQQTGRDTEAANLYNELAKGSAATVPPFEAQLALGDMYAAEGKTADANKVYAEVKDKDKDAKGQPGPAGQIAADKLAAKK